MSKNIVLIGMPGTFKSSAGIIAAKELNKHFADTDSLFEYFNSCTISEFFARHGEQCFRAAEEKVVAAAASYENVLIATGGGAVLSKKNTDNLKKSGFVIWLKARPNTILERTSKDDTRPLLSGGKPLKKIEELLDTRESLYSGCADTSIDTDGLSPKEVSDLIIKTVTKGDNHKE